MITRTLSRAKIVQILFAYYKNEGKTMLMVEKELLFSLQKTYDLYHFLLQLAIEITNYAEEKIDFGKNKLLPSEKELNPSTRFIDNAFVRQLVENTQLAQYIAHNKISWSDNEEILKNLYSTIVESKYYNDYMESEENDYQKDKQIWRKIFDKIVLNNKVLNDALEEMSIYWVNDIEVVESFVVKTIKRFEQERGGEQELLPMFNSEDDLQFAKKLLSQSLKNAKEYQEIINQHIKNWEFDRLAYMDTIIMQIALAELLSFPTIPINVTLNEYIEIAKGFSTEKSAQFINGVLDEVVTLLKKENKLIKAVLLSDKK